MKTVKRDIVGAFIFSSDDHILLVQSNAGGVYQDQWVVAGGGIEPGESHTQAVVREVSEELNMDISKARLAEEAKTYTGESKKTLRESGEDVIMQMTFYNFIVRLPKRADDIQFRAQDDIGKAQWFAVDALKDISLGGGTKAVLKDLGYEV